jgi:hypothetical protein
MHKNGRRAIFPHRYEVNTVRTQKIALRPPNSNYWCLCVTSVRSRPMADDAGHRPALHPPHSGCLAQLGGQAARLCQSPPPEGAARPTRWRGEKVSR